MRAVRGLDPRVHAAGALAWIAGSSPAMTNEGERTFPLTDFAGWRCGRRVCLVSWRPGINLLALKSGQAMRDVAGISRAYRCALIDTMDDLLRAPGLDHEVARRAQWLKWGLQGYEPGEQPLEFIDDSPPLVPAIEATQQTTAT